MTATVKRVERYTPLRRHLGRLRLHACGTAARGPFRMTARAEVAGLTRAARLHLIGRVYQVTCRAVSPGSRSPSVTVSSSIGMASRIPGKRLVSWPKAACSSILASGAPRQ